MILVVDSGSTKSDWVLIKGEQAIQNFETIGFNPNFHDSNFITHSILQNEDLKAIAPNITAVFYYGAGCSSNHRKEIIFLGLKAVFVQSKITVDHDLNGAAYSTFSGEQSIACILGTGSNSCYIENNRISKEIQIGGLGYILGDEGSGSFFGKKLLSFWLNGQLPNDISNAFVSKFKLSKDDIFKKIYNEKDANKFLASFMPFIHFHRNNLFIQEMITSGMELFLKMHVFYYPNYANLSIHFVGSVAYYFQDELRQAAKNLNINVGKIIHKPIDGLVRYHIMFAN